MDLNHCPSSATLADFSFGNGFSTSEIVLRAHISACRHCRTKIREIETIGSDLLMNEFHDHLGSFSEDIDSKVDEIVEGYDSSCDRNSAKSLNLSKSKADSMTKSSNANTSSYRSGFFSLKISLKSGRFV